MKDIYILNFKIGEENHKLRNWEQLTPPEHYETIIETFKDIVCDLCENWKNTNFDNYYDDMKNYITLIDKLYELMRYDNEQSEIIIFYDYPNERFIIEKQIDM
jgi:hypothetical protein